MKVKIIEYGYCAGTPFCKNGEKTSVRIFSDMATLEYHMKKWEPRNTRYEIIEP